MSQELSSLPEPEVEPLDDDLLENAAGGTGEICSLGGCSGGGVANP